MKTVIQKVLKLWSFFKLLSVMAAILRKRTGGLVSAKLPDFCHGYVSICTGFLSLSFFFFFFFFGERHTDCVFQRRVPTSIHHGTTLGQIHRKGSNPSSDYFIHVDLRPVNSSICKCSAERRVVVPL